LSRTNDLDLVRAIQRVHLDEHRASLLDQVY
jgi:hypothetical protein